MYLSAEDVVGLRSSERRTVFCDVQVCSSQLLSGATVSGIIES